MKELAFTDPLTLLLNRRRFIELSDREIKRCKRFKHSVALLLLDIDFFKSVNDNFGHPAGDVVLKMLSDFLKTVLREQDLLGRWGGEEFIILMPEVDANSAVLAAERIRQGIEELNPIVENLEINITVSIGLSSFDRGYDLDAMIANVDEALYTAKRTGRNKVVIRKDLRF